MDRQESIILGRAFDGGHFWSPEALQFGGLFDISDLAKLSPTSRIAEAALRSLSIAESVNYQSACQTAHNRGPTFDGRIGPAMAAMASVPRCHVPDIAPPPGAKFAFADPAIQQIAERMQRDAIAEAQGRGNWAGCHGVGDYHASVVRVDDRSVPQFLQPHLADILASVRAAYMAIGLRFDFLRHDLTDYRTGERWTGPINIEFSFVPRSSGWIGLAIVGKGETCGSTIWCKYLSTYRGGQTPQQIATQWTSLIKHELGHNCGLDHTRGGVMNPSIVNGLPAEWSPDDPSTPILKRQYGGEPVPPDGGSPKPPTPSMESRVAELESEVQRLSASVLAQQGINAYLLSELRK